MTRPALVLGGGGHAKVVIDLLLDAGVAVSAAIAANASEGYRGVPVLVGDDHLRDFDPTMHSCVVAIGDNVTRLRVAESVLTCGFDLLAAIGTSATVSRTATIEAGTVVMNGVVINADSRIGASCIINTGVRVDHDCIIGTGAHLAPGTALAGGVTVGERAFLGVGTAVIPGITIGADAIVGAGSVVVRDVPAGATVMGNPARAREKGAGPSPASK